MRVIAGGSIAFFVLSFNATASTIHYHGDLPDETHAWCVHDLNRPRPVKVAADEGKMPSDAIVLFDGTQESVDRNWCDKEGNPVKWKAVDGKFVCFPGSGYAFTKESFGDCQLHIEWMVPHGEVETGQGCGNSGVYLCNSYEIQILESFAPTHGYADGQAGALYGQTPPLVNPARAQGSWQSYDIIFHPAVWEGEKRVHPATMTVFFNGVLIHDQWELDGPTDWVTRAKPAKIPTCGQLSLQDHGHPVPFRNVWIRRIPSRWADKTHGGCAVEASEVARQRARNAARKAAEIQDGVFDFVNAERAIEAVAYDPQGGYGAKMRTVCDGLSRAIAAKDLDWVLANRDDLVNMRHLCKQMIERKLMTREEPLFAACKAAIAKGETDPRCVFAAYIIEGAKQSGISLAKAIERVMAGGIKAADVCVDEVGAGQMMCAMGMHVVSVYGFVNFLEADNGAKDGDELIAAADMLDSPRIMVIPQAFPAAADQEDCWKKTIDGLRKLIVKAKEKGLVVTVEDFGDPASPCSSVAGLKRLLDADPELRLTLDAGNFYVSGSGDDPRKALELFRDRIVHCHVKDYRAGKPGIWCPLGGGCIPNEQIVRTLRKSGYTGCFTIEESNAPDFLKAVLDAERHLSDYLK